MDHMFRSLLKSWSIDQRRHCGGYLGWRLDSKILPPDLPIFVSEYSSEWATAKFSVVCGVLPCVRVQTLPNIIVLVPRDTSIVSLTTPFTLQVSTVMTLFSSWVSDNLPQNIHLCTYVVLVQSIYMLFGRLWRVVTDVFALVPGNRQMIVSGELQL